MNEGNWIISGSKIVYVVDEDTGVLESTTDLLATAGFKTKGYKSAASFLKEYHPNDTACLMLDIMMPEMGGLAVQKELRARGVNLPIIITTSHGNVKMVVAAFKAGAVDFLEKPFRRHALINSIESALSLRGETFRGCPE